MSKPQPIYRRPLNQEQLRLLALLYKFRFGTSSLLMVVMGQKNQQAIYARLKILVEQQYIGKLYNSTYRLQGREARYFLLTNGIAMLKLDARFNTKVLKNIAKDKYASERFIKHNLNVFHIYAYFKQLYPDQFKYYCQSDLKKYDYFPKQLPDLYLLRIDTISNKPLDYFMDNFESTTPFFVHKQQIDHYLAYYADRSDKDMWGKTGRPYPVMMTICETEPLEQRVRTYITEIFDKEYIVDIAWHTSTLGRLLNACGQQTTKGLWDKV